MTPREQELRNNIARSAINIYQSTNESRDPVNCPGVWIRALGIEFPTPVQHTIMLMILGVPWPDHFMGMDITPSHPKHKEVMNFLMEEMFTTRINNYIAANSPDDDD